MKPLFPLFVLCAFPSAAQPVDSLSHPADTSKTLGNVVVVAGRRAIEVYPDKTVLNLDAQPLAIGENALDVLRRAPGVLVDGADNIGMNGKPSVAVFIDGKNTQLSAQDLAQLLKSIEGANIRQIELITNPSAKWDAGGAAGIINIKLKKNVTDGFNGTMSGSYVQSRHARGNGTVNLNWRKARTALFFNGGLNSGLQHVVANNDRIVGDKTFTQRSIEKDGFGGSSIRGGIDHTVSKHATVGLLWMHNTRQTNMDNSSTTLMQAPNGKDTGYTTRSTAPFDTKRNAFNLNYQFSAPKTEYSFDADYTRHQSSVHNLITNDLRDHLGVKFGATATGNNQRVQIHLYSLKGDFVQSLSPKTKVEAGFKLVSTRTNNRLEVENQQGRQWLQDTGKTNRFRYAEDIRALYGALKGASGAFSWQVGLRAEQTTVKGRSTDLKMVEVSAPDASYLNLFPSLFGQYSWATKHQLGIAANRRIDRPNYQDQNPFIYFLDALNREQGNAYLQPQFTNNIELSYTYNYATTLKVGYAHTSDYIEWVTLADDKFTVQTPQNAGTKRMLSFSFSSPVKYTKRWSGYVSLTPYYHYYNVVLSRIGGTERQQGGSWAFNSYIGNNVELGKGWKGSFGGWFNFQNRATIYVSKPLGSFDVGVQKGVFGDKVTLKLSAVDVFNTQQWEQRATDADLWLNTYRKWESRNITIGASWRFGNQKVKSARERSAAGEEDGKRIKS